MTNAAFFAPIIRGAALEAAGTALSVKLLSDKHNSGSGSDLGSGLSLSSDKAKKTLHIDINSFDFAEDTCSQVQTEQVITTVRAAFKNIGQADFPLSVKAVCAGKSECFYIEQTQPIQTDSRDTHTVCRNDTVKNRIALVTGGAQGFGEELVRGLVKNGATVFIADLNLAGAQKLAQQLNGEYGRTAAFAVQVNVADENSVSAMCDYIAENAGGLDLCISNAGVLRASSILEQDMSSFRFVTDINYTAFAVVTKHCARLMKLQNEASAGTWTSDIIQINSKSGLEGSNKNGSYAGGKFGGIGLVESFALELVAYGIKVNAICPGNFFDGPLWSDPEKGLFVQYLKAGKVPGAKTTADVKAFYEAKVPMKRGCTGNDVLKAVLYIVEQTYETGQAVPVTGGQVMLH